MGGSVGKLATGLTGGLVGGTLAGPMFGLPSAGAAMSGASGGSGKPQPPGTPDLTGAAIAQQQSGMVNQNTPYGSQTFTQTGTPGTPGSVTSNINLSPQQQAILGQQQQASLQSGQQANQQLSQFGSQGPFQGGQNAEDIYNKAYGAMTSRLDPQWQMAQQQQDTQLRNQGLTPGSEAYNNAMRVFNQSKNDAYQQATLGAIQTMPQTFGLAQQAYEMPLNIAQALQGGEQLNNPQFQQFGQAPMLGAAQSQMGYNADIYNQKMAQQNALTGGLFSLGGSLGAAALMSDRRLKSNIKRIGTHPLGIGIYEYDIFGGRTTGVMADEVEKVKPEAVFTFPSGFKGVDYGRL